MGIRSVVTRDYGYGLVFTTTRQPEGFVWGILSYILVVVVVT